MGRRLALTHEQARFELYLTHRSALIDYATPILGERARAEDVVQEAFLRFVPRTTTNDAANENGGGPVEQPVSYLYRIVRNLAFDVVRRRRSEAKHVGEPEWWMLPAEIRTPEEDMIHQQSVARVEAVLANMPAQARLAVEMSRFGGYTLQEIAYHLGVSAPTVHRMVRDGLLKLAMAMNASGG